MVVIDSAQFDMTHVFTDELPCPSDQWRFDPKAAIALTRCPAGARIRGDLVPFLGIVTISPAVCDKPCPSIQYILSASAANALLDGESGMWLNLAISVGL